MRRDIDHFLPNSAVVYATKLASRGVSCSAEHAGLRGPDVRIFYPVETTTDG
jgi:hypothetical protein